MGTLLRQHGHQLLQRAEGLPHVPVNHDLVAVDEVGRMRGIVERVVPLPRHAPLVVVGEDPGQALHVCLPDLDLQLGHLFLRSDEELGGVVAVAPAGITELDNVLVFFDFFLLLCVHLFLHFDFCELVDDLCFLDFSEGS